MKMKTYLVTVAFFTAVLLMVAVVFMQERDEARQMVVGVCQALEVIGDTSRACLKRGESNILFSPELVQAGDGSRQVAVVWENLSNGDSLEYRILRNGEVWQIDWAREEPRQIASPDSKSVWQKLFEETQQQAQ